MQSTGIERHLNGCLGICKNRRPQPVMLETVVTRNTAFSLNAGGCSPSSARTPMSRLAFIAKPLVKRFDSIGEIHRSVPRTMIFQEMQLIDEIEG